MGTTTTTFALNKPTVGGDDNAWGGDWNSNADKLDDLLDGTTGITPNLIAGWEVGGVAVTSTAAELNVVDGADTTLAPQILAQPKGFLDPENRIINGAFDFWQRGTSFTTFVYGADRWLNTINPTASATMSRQAFTLGDTLGGNNPTYFLRQTVSGQTNSDHVAVVQQPIESVRSYAGQTITVLGWVRRSSGSGNMAVSLDQNFGTGGSPSAEVPGTGQTVTLTSSWAPFALTFSVPSVSGKTLGTNGNDYLLLSLFTSAGSDFNARTNSLGLQTIGVDLWGVHIKVGTHTTAATDLYKQPEIGPEFARCQRFYYRYQEAGFQRFAIVPAVTTNRESPVFFGVTLRATPSVTISGGSIYRFSGGGISDGGGTSTTVPNITQFGCLQISSGFSAGTIGEMCATDNWLIQADAEL